MHAELFEPCQVIYGDTRARGYAIKCGKCSAIGRIPMNTFKGSPDEYDKVNRMVAGKFGKQGWLVATRPGAHRCPSCVRLTKPLAAKLAHLKETTSIPGIEMMNGTKLEAKMPAAEPVKLAPVRVIDVVTPASRVMSREDGRKVYDKLNEVYRDEAYGYLREWNDARVAMNLDVPLDWVVKVREQWFGPERGTSVTGDIEELRKALQAVDALREELAALNKRVDKLNLDAKPIVTIAEKARATLATLDKGA